MKRTIARKIFLLLLIVTGAGMSSAGVMYWLHSTTASYGSWTRLVARQSMLLEQMQPLSDGGDQPLAERLLILVELERSARKLEEELAIANKSARRELETPVADLRDAVQELRLTLEGPPGRPIEGLGADETRERLTSTLAGALSNSQTLRMAVEAMWHSWRSSLLYGSVAAATVTLVALAFGLHFAYKEILGPLRLVKETAVQAEKGDLDETPPVPRELKTVVHTLGHMSDKVERLRAERDDVEADYRSIFQNTVVGIFELDNTKRRFALANPAMARLLGFGSPMELTSRITDVRQQLFANPDEAAEFEGLCDSREQRSIEAEVCRNGGGSLWAMIGVHGAVCDDGSVDHYEGVLVDISPRKRAEASLRRLSSRLLQLQDEERRRIARELHDSTGQALAALEINLSRLQDFAPESALPLKARQVLSESIDLVKDCSRQTRSISYLLHPPLLDELGLAFALQDYSDGYSKRSGIEVELDVSSTLGRFRPDVETALFRVVQESLTNVQRHSKSRKVEIRISTQNGEVHLEVKDYGRGIPRGVLDRESDSAPPLGVGLRGMEERVKQLGGRLWIESSPRGTTVKARLAHLSNIPRKSSTSTRPRTEPTAGRGPRP